MSDQQENWAEKKEVAGGFYGIKLMLFFYRLGGKKLFTLVLYPVMTVYYLMAREQRRNSKRYLSLVNKRRTELGLKKLRLNSFMHFIAFADMMLDKLNAWQGKLELHKDVEYIDDSFNEFYKNKVPGKIIICSHLGDIEALNAIFTKNKDEHYVINSIVFNKHVQNFNRMIKALAPDVDLNLISTDTMGADTAILLRDKLDHNEIVVIAGDRVPQTSHEHNRVVKAKFLGEDAYFPQGCFVLSSVLKAPTILVFALKNNKTNMVDIVCKNIGIVKLDRKNREASLQAYVDNYAKVLEEICLEYPYQWFNFYDFFKAK